MKNMIFRRFCLLCFLLTLMCSCAHPKYGNIFDTTGSDGLAVLVALLSGGLGTQPRLGYSWELIFLSDVPLTHNAVAVVYQGRVWLLGGTDRSGFRNTISYFSDDGRTFFSTPGFVPNDNTVYGQPAAVSFNGAIYYAVHTIENNGNSSLRVYSSPNGATYTQRYLYSHGSSDTVGEPALTVFNGRLFAYDFGLTFYSDDGTAWTNGGATGITEDAMETSNSTAVFAGQVVREYRGGIFTSTDGIAFMSLLAPDSQTSFQDHLVFDDRLFSVLEIPGTSTMFESRDLRTRSTASPLNTICCKIAPFDAYHDYASVVFRNRMRFYGGRSVDSPDLFGSAWFSLGGGVGIDGGTHSDVSK